MLSPFFIGSNFFISNNTVYAMAKTYAMIDNTMNARVARSLLSLSKSNKCLLR